MCASVGSPRREMHPEREAKEHCVPVPGADCRGLPGTLADLDYSPQPYPETLSSPQGRRGKKLPLRPTAEEPQRPSPELDRVEIGRLNSIVTSDPGWIAFSASEAKWVNFVPEMRQVFNNYPHGTSSLLLVERWLDESVEVLSTWISRQIIKTESRAAQFRALGRGWIMVQLSSAGARIDYNSSKLIQEQRTRFKWWFENIDRILRNRQTEIERMQFNTSDEKLEKYTIGYMPMSEFVFLVNGLCPARGAKNLDPQGRPVISIQKWCSNYRDLDRWAASDELVREAVKKPEATDEERHQHAAAVQQQKSRKQRQKEKQKLKKQQERAAQAMQEEQEKRASSVDEFQKLIAAYKAEEQEKLASTAGQIEDEDSSIE